MVKRIALIVEDLSAELASAKQAAIAAGFTPVVTANLADALRVLEEMPELLAGVVTDLHFPESDRDENPNKPCGLAVIAAALDRDLPVVVCSSINHHHVGYFGPILGRFAKGSVHGRIPTVFDRKDWQDAFEKLAALVRGARPTQGEPI